MKGLCVVLLLGSQSNECLVLLVVQYLEHVCCMAACICVCMCVCVRVDVIKFTVHRIVQTAFSRPQNNAALDVYGHHALCCKLGGDVVSRHNRLIDIFNDFCHCACLAPQLEMGGWSKQHTHPADVLVPNWVDLCVTSMLNTQVFQEASVTAGSAALAAQTRKHRMS